MSRIIPFHIRPEPPIEIKPRSPRWSIEATCILVWMFALFTFGCTLVGLWDILAMIHEGGPFR